MTAADLNPHKIVATKEQLKNMDILAEKMSDFEDLMGRSFLVTSGLRTQAMQNQINPANRNSCHLIGAAVDCSDVDGEIYQYALENIDLMIRLGLYFESRTYTRRWIHAQFIPPKSGNRFFIP